MEKLAREKMKRAARKILMQRYGASQSSVNGKRGIFRQVCAVYPELRTLPWESATHLFICHEERA